uniref:Uncharacterized protein n=1 Tax=Manihot esculenta TaxID=3983 RepID=A0A2C9V4Q1_MANES
MRRHRSLSTSSPVSPPNRDQPRSIPSTRDHQQKGLPRCMVTIYSPATTSSHRLELNQIRERDGFRHRRILQSSGGVVDFPV